MASIAVYGHDFQLHSDKILAMELTARGQSALIINVARSGDELADITEVMQGELMFWLQQDTYDGILPSAGGNDFIDAARSGDWADEIHPNAGGWRELAKVRADAPGF